MLLCRVTGTTVTTVHAGGLGGARLLVVRPEDGGAQFVAVDAAGAGPGDLVLVSQGSAARIPAAAASAPTDAAVVGVVDEASHAPDGSGTAAATPPRRGFSRRGKPRSGGPK